MSEKSQHNNILLAVVGLITVIVLVGLIGFFTLSKNEEIIQGEVEVSEFRVSCKLPGRISKILVEEGQFVHVGDTLAILEIPEATAQQKVAEATEGAVSALSSLADSGTRKEIIESAEKVLDAALAANEIAEKTFNRINNLFNEGVISAQRKDEALAAYKATQAQVEGARSQLQMAKNGARSQEKEAAHKQAEAAKSAVDVVSSLLKETVQVAAVDGEVSAIYPKEGELVGLGSPIMNISIMKDLWATFNIREDQLNGMKVGDTFKAFLPAFNQEIELKVSHIKDAGSYAVWKATKTNGQYDVKTFEVKAKPTKAFEGLRPGMSLIVKE
ncbi:MAG: HlyD family efflux transporter periplasmic adaptor subunit [Bacteroidaceae bacterium]|nr:HlyD family efflux transporter periplasmic adaptor subunit [Bacteroidaceae bacterium]